MGIRGIETAMKNCPNCIRRVKLSDLIMKDSDNVIIVDGNQFYECYIYRLFDWVHVGVKNLLKETQIFVDSFRSLGVHLVFVFKHSGPADPDRRGEWVKKRQGNVKFNDEILRLLNVNEDVPEERKFSDRLEHGKFFVIQILRSMNCEVHCEIRKNGTRVMIEQALRRKALGLLSQNSYIVFYDTVPRYLSIKKLDLNEMETEEYNIDPLAEDLQLDRQLFPLLATILGENELVNTNHPFQLARNNIHRIIYRYMKGLSYLVKVATFIRENWRQDDSQNFLKRMFGRDGETLVPAYKEFQSRFITAHNEHDEDTLFPINQPYVSSCNAEIIARIEEMVRRGEMFPKVHHIVVRNVFEQYIIPEDYKTLPSSGLVFRSLRKKLYGILFRCTSNTEIKIEEWYMDGGLCISCQESPDPINEELHPGLLTLWDDSSDEVTEKKWILFCSAISPNLDIDLLRKLPQNLIVPTTVLFYLCNEMSRCSLSSNYDLLEPWEFEVFIAQLILFSSISVEASQLQEEKSCARSVMLCAFFVSGCFYMNMLVQVCGYPVARNDVKIFNYFDGVLFHYLYKIAKKQGVRHLITSELREDFLKIKRILNLN